MASKVCKLVPLPPKVVCVGWLWDLKVVSLQNFIQWIHRYNYYDNKSSEPQMEWEGIIVTDVTCLTERTQKLWYTKPYGKQTWQCNVVQGAINVCPCAVQHT